MARKWGLAGDTTYYYCIKISSSVVSSQRSNLLAVFGDLVESLSLNTLVWGGLDES